MDGQPPPQQPPGPQPRVSNKVKRKLKKAEKDGEIEVGKAERNEDGFRHQTMMMTKQRLEDIAQRPNTTVYEWDTSDCVAQPMDTIEPVLLMARDSAKKLREEHPEWCDDEVRRQIVRDNQDVKSLFKEHGKVFEFVTSSDTDEEKMDIIRYMIDSRRRIEEGKVDHVQQEMELARFLQSRFIPGMGGATPAQAQQTQKKKEKPLTGAQKRRAKRGVLFDEAK